VARVSFELTLSSVSVSEVDENLPAYKQAIAASLSAENNLSIEPGQIEIEVMGARRLRRLLAGVVLEVSIKAFSLTSADSISAVIAQSNAFATNISSELADSGIVTDVSIDDTTITTTILASTTPAPSPAVKEPEAGGGGGGVIGGALGALILVAAFGVYMYRKGQKSKEAKAKVYSEPSIAENAATTAQAVSSGRTAIQPVVPVIEDTESKQEEVVADPGPTVAPPAIKGPTAGLLSPELTAAQLDEDDLDADDLDDMGDMNVLGPPAFFGEWDDDDEEETPPGTPQD
jgi:hypothetical protein